MCGIFCSVSRQSHVHPSPDVLELLQRRGPDSTGRVEQLYTLPDTASERDFHLTFTSTVLSLRGSSTVTQPYLDRDETAILCWNGEAWSIASEKTSDNDTRAVHVLLSQVTPFTVSSNVRSDAIGTFASQLASIAGPYAFVFYDSARGILYFGRDFLGRRSLLWKIGHDGELLLSSVTSGSLLGSWTEVEADGVYCLDLKHQAEDVAAESFGSFIARKTPYYFMADAKQNNIHSVIPLLSLNKQIPSKHGTPLAKASPAVSRLELLLRDSLAVRVFDIPDPPRLLNEPTSVLRPARLAVLFSGGLDCTMLARITHDLLPVSEPIDLLNVAFENPRIHKTADTTSGSNDLAYELCPDRITGRASYAELQAVCSIRNWRFVAINIPYAETTAHRDRVITIMHPHNTEMDLSIAYALYFAARGTGTVLEPVTGKPDPQPFTTSARVLLSGLGADELFAGYTRHATAFNRRGHEGLIDELDLDITRLGKRNLGRDDRVISNWGREARFPFLDEKLVAWALAAPVSDKCGFGETEPGVIEDHSVKLEPGKKVLRCLAWKMGMRNVAAEKKRAIQFGARTAKMTTGKSKGTTLLS